MTIRGAIHSDIPAIVELLKLGLGEGLTPKSVSFWNWKHVNNPFGESKVILAFEGQQLVGVRAFMMWTWNLDGKKVNAVRAVDTVTHPEHQGKGIFKKLTLGLLEELKGSDYEFVFNTPNRFSKPGYLKMGWQEAGRLPVRFHILHPFQILSNLINKPVQQLRCPGNLSEVLADGIAINSLIEEHKARHSERIVTNLSVDFLRWRYLGVPVGTYIGMLAGEKHPTALLIARTKDTRMGREFRITEYVKGKDHDPKAVREMIVDKAISVGADYITSSGTSEGIVGWIRLARGPHVTVFDLNKSGYFYGLEGFRRWSPSLGDLELF